MTDQDEPSQDATSEFDPRVTIHSVATGEVTPVRRDAVQGLDDFIQGWEHNTHLPHRMNFSAWQMADDAHPAGAGAPGYRIVHKTIRTFAFPQVSLTYANLRVSFQTGPVTWGEPRFKGAFSSRSAGSFLVPEWGELDESGDGISCNWEPNVIIDIEAHQETTPSANHVEILYELPPGEWAQYEDMSAAGRASVSALTMMIDFLFGERVLGPIVTEEVGELFDDWHWNRRLGGRAVAIESQARLEAIDGNQFAARVSAAVDDYLDRTQEERNRIKIASQWYWRADGEPEMVQQYIAYWLCIEALELGENANIAPVKQRVAELLGVEPSVVSDAVGRVYSTRNGLVHGNIREVDVERLERVRALAVALLELHSLGRVSVGSLSGLRWAMGLWDVEGEGTETT